MAAEDGQADLVVRNAKVTTRQVEGDVAEALRFAGSSSWRTVNLTPSESCSR
jgi:hypothetical protein